MAKDRFKWFPLVVADFDAEPAFASATLEARGLIISLVLAYWNGECRGLPDDPNKLARLVGCTPGTIRKNREVISVYFAPDTTGLLQCNLLNDKWKHAKEVSEQKRRAANAMHEKERAYAAASAEQMPRDGDEDGDTPLTTPTDRPSPHDTTGPLAGSVDSAIVAFGIDNQSHNGNGVERYAQTMFYALFPSGPYVWEDEKNSLIASVKKYGRGPFNVAAIQLEERRRERKRIENELGYLIGTARGECEKKMSKHKASLIPGGDR